VDPPGPPGCSDGWIGFMKSLAWLIRVLVGRVLGDVKAK
jgi:hypothetical protein